MLFYCPLRQPRLNPFCDESVSLSKDTSDLQHVSHEGDVTIEPLSSHTACTSSTGAFVHGGNGRRPSIHALLLAGIG